MNEELPGARPAGGDDQFAALWALDALDDDERAAYEERLRRDPAERAVADGLRATAARLGAATPAEPPGHLRRSVLAAIASLPQEPPLAPTVTTPAVTAPAAPGVGDLAAARARRSERAPARRDLRRWPLLVAAAAVVVAAVGVGAGLDARDDAARVQAQAASERGAAQQLARLLNAPGAQVVSVAGAHGGSATVVRADGRAAVVGELPAVSAGKTYQVWVIGAGGVRSAGLMSDGTMPFFVADAANASAIGISVEPAAGSPAPTTDPVVVANLA